MLNRKTAEIAAEAENDGADEAADPTSAEAPGEQVGDNHCERNVPDDANFEQPDGKITPAERSEPVFRWVEDAELDVTHGRVTGGNELIPVGLNAASELLGNPAAIGIVKISEIARWQRRSVFWVSGEKTPIKERGQTGRDQKGKYFENAKPEMANRGWSASE